MQKPVKMKACDDFTRSILTRVGVMYKINKNKTLNHKKPQ